METSEPVEVWYDGACPICRRSRSWSERRDSGGRLVFRDVRATRDERLPASRDRHEATMIVSTPSGQVLEGYAAWRQILAVIPGWSWLARMSGLPPLRWIGPLAYRLVARWRYRLSTPLLSEPERGD